MASIRQLKSGKWQVRWKTTRGEDASPRTFPAGARGEALKFKREVEVLLARGEDWVDRSKAALVDLEDLFEKYLHHQKHVRRLADATGEQLAIGLNLFVDYLRTQQPRGRLWPELLTRESIEGFFLWVVTERVWKGRKGMSALTGFQHARKVCRAWSWLHARHQDAVAPPVEVDLPNAQPALRPEAITWAECDAAIAEIRLEWQRRLMVACRYTGLRKGQVMRILKTDLDFGRHLLTIRPELGKSPQERRGRVIPVSVHLVEEVKGWGKRDEGWLIETTGNKKGNQRAIDYEAFRRAWREGTGRAPRQPFHGFRKAMQQGLRSQGVAVDVIQFLVGHDRGTTGDVYIGDAALMDEAARAVALIPRVGEVRAANELAAKRRTRAVDTGE